MAEQHRTDCIKCGARIYHDPLDTPREELKDKGLEFFGHREKGEIFYHVQTEHYILLAEDDEPTVATCRDYWELADEFNTFERIVVGTKHKIAAKKGDLIPF